MNWIATKDKLPDTFKDVLLWSTLHNDLFVGYYHQDGVWVYAVLQTPDCGVEESFESVSHWRPLPRPPKKF